MRGRGEERDEAAAIVACFELSGFVYRGGREGRGERGERSEEERMRADKIRVLILKRGRQSLIGLNLDWPKYVWA